MSTFRDPFKTNAMRLQDKKGGVKWLYLSEGGALEMAAVNTLTTDWVPQPLSPFFMTALSSPSIPDNTFPEMGVPYTGLRIQMDAELGMSSSVRSLNGAEISGVVVRDNEIQFSYHFNTLSDSLEILSWNKSGTESRRFRRDFDLVTLLDSPDAWVGVIPNTQGKQYTGLQMSFKRPVVSLTGMNSTAGLITNFVVVDGRVQFDYLPPLGPSDTLTFTEVFDGLTTNASPVSFVVQDLMVAPSVIGFSQSPTSQSYSSDVIVSFSKAIASCSVSRSGVWFRVHSVEFRLDYRIVPIANSNI